MKKHDKERNIIKCRIIFRKATKQTATTTVRSLSNILRKKGEKILNWHIKNQKCETAEKDNKKRTCHEVYSPLRPSGWQPWPPQIWISKTKYIFQSFSSPQKLPRIRIQEAINRRKCP